MKSEKKPESLKEAADNISNALKLFGGSMGSSKEIGMLLAKAMQDDELGRLIQAATQKRKDDHEKMMRKARGQLVWLLILLLMAVTYTHWGIPFLECYFFGVCK